MLLKLLVVLFGCLALSHGGYEGDIKIFLSVEIENVPWGDSLKDHYSDGYIKLAEKVNTALQTYAVVKNPMRSKVIQFSPLPDAILAKIIVKLADSEMAGIAKSVFLESLIYDVDNSGIMGACLDVRNGTVIVHDIEKDKGCGQESCPEDSSYHTYEKPAPYVDPSPDTGDTAHPYVDPQNITGPKDKCTGLKLLHFVLLDETWKPEYADRKSDEYAELVERVMKAFDEAFKDIENYAGIEVLSFRDDPGNPDVTMVKLNIHSYVFEKNLCFDDVMSANIHYRRLQLLAEGKIGDEHIHDFQKVVTDQCRVNFVVKEAKEQFKDTCKVVVYHRGRR